MNVMTLPHPLRSMGGTSHADLALTVTTLAYYLTAQARGRPMGDARGVVTAPDVRSGLPIRIVLKAREPRRSEEMNRIRNADKHDLVADIIALESAISRQAASDGLDRYLMDRGRMDVVLSQGVHRDSAEVSVRFKPNHGIEHKLTTLVTIPGLISPIDTQGVREELAALFCRHMSYLKDRVSEAAASRAKIRRAAEEVFAAAREEGLDLEVLHIQPAPTHVYNEPGARGASKQVFYVHVLMPHDDAGVLTEDSWTIDADDAEEFAMYLRDRTVPEIRETVAALSQTVDA